MLGKKEKLNLPWYEALSPSDEMIENGEKERGCNSAAPDK